jgi:Protein of unknown function (DUF3485)
MTNILRLTAAAFVIGVGLVHGSWTNRWRPAPALTALGGRLESLPMVIGDWTATPYQLPPRELAAAGAVGSLSRRYTDASRGVTVSVLLLSGLPGDICTHTPDACYPGAGFTLGPAAVFSRGYGSPERPAEFRTALATRGGVNPSVLRIFWSWNDTHGWSAPENQRWKFAAVPALCKLYVIRETAGREVDPRNDPCNDFLALLLPELDRCVFSAPR